MWFPANPAVTVTNGFYTATKIAPNGNAALKIQCTKPFTMMAINQEEEKTFLY
jgi:hypothetical protein